MSPAQRFMHADAGGYLLPSCIASLPAVSKISSNTIRKAINACTDLSKGEKRMLSEVCSFVQLGKTGVCDAKNAHFVTECLIAKDSVSRILAKLEDRGLVTVDPGKERGNKRLIWPTKRALALYMTPAQLGALGGEDQAPELSTNVDTPIDQIMQTLSTFVDTPIDFLQGGLSTFSGEAIDFLRVSLLIVKERYLNVIKNEEEESEKSTSPSTSIAQPQIEEIVTPRPASPKAEPQTEGGAAARRPSAHAEAEQLTTADACPLLNNPTVFKAACLDINPAYAGIDFEHYRLEMRFDSLERSLILMPFEWRKRLRNWLSNAKANRSGLILAAVPGQTLGDSRAIKPLASKSSSSPTKAKSWK